MGATQCAVFSRVKVKPSKVVNISGVINVFNIYAAFTPKRDCNQYNAAGMRQVELYIFTIIGKCRFSIGVGGEPEISGTRVV